MASGTPSRLVADYCSTTSEESSSDEESIDSEPDSDVTDFAAGSSEESDKIDEILKPVEELSITVDPSLVTEIGSIKHTVDNQVVVEPLPGSPALDLNTVLFLDEGNKTLGRIDDVFGKVSEPYYLVYFNSASEIKKKGIQEKLKVYYAPETKHTNFVFVSELMKLKGSDASWEHNQEPPEEFDFSDDEAEKAARRRNGHQQPASTNRDSRPRDHRQSPRPFNPNHRRSPSFSPQRHQQRPFFNSFHHPPRSPRPPYFPCSPNQEANAQMFPMLPPPPIACNMPPEPRVPFNFPPPVIGQFNQQVNYNTPPPIRPPFMPEPIFNGNHMIGPPPMFQSPPMRPNVNYGPPFPIVPPFQGAGPARFNAHLPPPPPPPPPSS